MLSLLIRLTHHFILLTCFFSLSSNAFGLTRIQASLPRTAMDRIDKAIPEALYAAPVQPRHVLIFTLCKGYRHQSIPYGVYALTELGIKTGAYESTVSNDPDMFQKDKLNQFDAVIFLNTTGELFSNQALQDNLLQFVNQGGGFVGIHAAADCFYHWQEYGEMLGAYFDGHPWNERVSIKVDQLQHPLTAMFPDNTFYITDEIYQFRYPYSRDNLLILTSLDTDNTNMTKSDIHRKDDDFAVSWIHRYGRGHVFYCSLGHRNEIYSNPIVLQHYLAGIQYAIGDLNTVDTLQDTSPSNTDLADAFIAARDYKFGSSRKSLAIIEQAVLSAKDHNQQHKLETQLLVLLQTPDATEDCKAFACRQLALTGSKYSVSTLAKLLPDKMLSHMARFALERIDDRSAEDALFEALHELRGNLRIGVINSIAARGNPRNVERLFTAAIGVDEETRVAITEAIGKIGGNKAAKLLLQIRKSAIHNDSLIVKDAATHAMLCCASHLIQDGEMDTASRLYESILSDESDNALKWAALQGLAYAHPLKSLPLLMNILISGNTDEKQRASHILIDAPGNDVSRVLAERLPHLPPVTQADLINILAARGDKKVLSTITDIINSEDTAVRNAAIEALGILGDETTVPVLSSLAGDGNEIAVISLVNLHNDTNVNTAISKHLLNASPHERSMLIRVLGLRNAVDQIDVIFAVANTDPAMDVRISALETISAIAGEKQVPDLVNMIARANNPLCKQKAADALVSAIKRSDDQIHSVQLIADAISELPHDNLPIFIDVLRRIGSFDAANIVKSLVFSEDTGISRIALQALTDWTDDGAAEVLLDIAGSSLDSKLQTEAYGFLRVIQLNGKLSLDQIVHLFRRIMPLAQTAKQTKTALKTLADFPAADSIKLAERYLRSKTSGLDAAETILHICLHLPASQRTIGIAAIQKVLNKYPDNVHLYKEAGKAMNSLQKDQDFIEHFLYSGPYTSVGADATKLINMPFSPEIDINNAIWNNIPQDAITDPGIIDLNQINPGQNRCAYLWINIKSETEQEARLEFGSDDGIKVFLNGRVVLNHMIYRALTIGEDVCTVTLKQGHNQLLLKIVQGSGDWKVSCRIRDPDGYHLQQCTILRPEYSTH